MSYIIYREDCTHTKMYTSLQEAQEFAKALALKSGCTVHVAVVIESYKAEVVRIEQLTQWIDFSGKTKDEFEQWVHNKEVTVKDRNPTRLSIIFIEWICANDDLALCEDAFGLKHKINYRKKWRHMK